MFGVNRHAYFPPQPTSSLNDQKAVDPGMWFWIGLVNKDDQVTDQMSDFSWMDDGTPFVFNGSYMDFNPLYRDASTPYYCTQLTASSTTINRFGFHGRRPCGNSFGFMCQFDCASGES